VNHSTSLRDENGCLSAAGNPAAARIPRLAPSLDWFTGRSNCENLSSGIDDNRHFRNTMNRDQRIFKAFEEHPLALPHWIPNPY